MFTRSLFCLLYFFIHSILKSSAILQQMQFLENENAKNKFCSQKFFDTLSYDGQSYRFTVKYRHNDFTHFSSSIEKFYYDEFKIRYHPSSKLFTYQMTTYNFANLVPLGGFYADNFQVYYEFYRNISKKAIDQHRYMYCVYPDSTSPPRGKVVDRCHCNSRDNPCLVPNQKFTFFPNRLHCQLKSNRFVTFVYQFDSQKMIYIFSNRTDPTVLSSTRITNLQNEITWFTKSIPYKSHQFIGAFNWHTDKSDKIFVLVASNWKRKNLTLREVVDTKKFVLSTEDISWKVFFGCESSMGQIESLSSSKPRSNQFVLYIGCLICLIVAFTLVVAIRNLSGFKPQRCAAFWPFRFENKYLSRFININ